MGCSDWGRSSNAGTQAHRQDCGLHSGNLNRTCVHHRHTFSEFNNNCGDCVDKMLTWSPCSSSYLQDSNSLLTGGNDKVLRIYDLNKPEAGKSI